jgi:mannan endo-1,4-beta-mannosidase
MTRSPPLRELAWATLFMAAFAACAGEVSSAGPTGGANASGGNGGTGGKNPTGGNGPNTGGKAGSGGSSGSGGSGPADSFYVKDGKLYDPCGEAVLLRGINRMAIYADPGGKSYPALAKTGANAVRIMWQTDPSVGADTLAANLQAAVDAKLIPVPGLWDATGDFSKMSAVEDWWTSDAVVAVVKRFTDEMIVNIANEAGNDVSDGDWGSTYNRIIMHLRQKGVHALLAVDAANYGRNVEQLLRLAPSVLAADPDHNVIFDWHEYDASSTEKARITKAFELAVSQKLALMVGEFASGGSGACDRPIPYSFLMAEAQRTGVGYFPWSWDNFNGDCKMGGSSLFDMVSDPLDASTLRPGWATEVCISDPNSIQKTSVRPHLMATGSCR